MSGVQHIRAAAVVLLALATGLLLVACANRPDLPPLVQERPEEVPKYLVGPLDNLNIFVWKQPELGGSVTVRPDGRISIPLIEDLSVSGKTPSVVAREIEKKLSTYVREPFVTVMVGGFNGPFSQQVRVVGEATRPQALSYRANMTLLDVMILVGGLTAFSDGNASTVIRTVGEDQQIYRARLADLVKDGDISANAEVLPGDIIIVPESFF